MKKITLLFLLSLLNISLAQTTVTIGTQVVQSGTTGISPYNYYWESRRVQFVYTASEIIAAGGFAGSISAIAFDVSEVNGGNLVNYTIRMAHTSATDASSHNTATLNEVKSAHTLTPGSTGWRTITFDNNFEWNGTDNILVDVCWGVNTGWGSNGQVWLYNNVANQMRGISSSSSNQCGSTTTTTRNGKPRVQFTITSSANMTYQSSTTEQASTSPVVVGSTNQPVIRLKVETSGSQNPFNVTSITFTTGGTTNTNDLTAAKVYYTTSTTFSTANQFGTTINNPSGTLTFTGTQQLATGNNYFWLAYDISSSATVNNVVDGTCTQFVTSDGPTTRNPDVTDPTGSRTIKAPLSGTVNVGTSQEYTSLTGSGGLFEIVNLLGLSGDLEVLITSDLSEDGTNALNQWTETGGGGYYLTIKPSSNVVRIISGSYAGGLIRLNGADRVTIDGRFSGSGNYLSFTNNNNTASAAVIWVNSQSATNPATDVTIRNCIVTGGGSSTLGGIVVSGSTLGGVAEADNTNTKILFNQVRKAQYGIALVGNSAGQTNSEVLNNNVGSTTPADKISLVGMFISNQQDCQVSNNTVIGLSSSAASNSSAGISIAGVSLNSVINANEIADIKNTNTGGWGATGILLGSSTTNTNLRVSNNVIYDIAGYGWSGNITDNGIGIRVTLGGGYNIDFNSVNLATNQTVAGQSAAIYIEGFGTGFNLRNNIFANQQTTGTRYAIYSAVSNTAFDTINFNDYFSTQHVGFLSSNQSNLSAWQTATGQDGSSIEDNPMFTGNTDLRPQSGSPVLNTGVPISGITTDFLGDPRDANPSRGAYENPFTPATPPNCPNLASPANSSTGISVQPTLQWSDGGGGTSGYKLYFGTDNPPTNINNGTDLGNVTSYTFSSNLNFLTTYYWRIVSYNNNGDASGCEIRSFTTSPDPTAIPKFEQFNLSSFPAGWSQMYSGGVTSNRWNVNNTNNAGGTAYEMRAAYQFATGVSRLIVGPLNTSGIVSLTLKFRHYYEDWGTGATFKIQSSADNSNWTDESYSFNSGNGNLGPAIVTTMVTNNLGSQTYIAWTIDGNHSQFDYWYIDDVQIYVTPSASNTQNIPGGNTDPTTFTGTGTIIQFTTANTGAVDLSVERINSSPGGPLPSGLTNLGPVYWNIDVTSGTVNGTYSITFDVSGVPGVNNPSLLRLLKRANPNEPWTNLGTPNSVSGTLVTWTGLTSFSEFGMGGDNNNPLPVELTSFVATTKGRDVILNWKTETEVNSAKFVVERKHKNNDWTSIAEVKASGNSNSPKEYSYLDKKLNSGAYQYRLKMIDNDGTYSYSDVVEGNVELPKEYGISQNYPNPFNPTTKIDYQLPFDSKVMVELYSITGEKVAEIFNGINEAGYYTLDVNGSSLRLASGVYIYRILATNLTNGQVYMNVKKMMMLK